VRWQASKPSSNAIWFYLFFQAFLEAAQAAKISLQSDSLRTFGLPALGFTATSSSIVGAGKPRPLSGALWGGFLHFNPPIG
jgi:hypothetical protein